MTPPPDRLTHRQDTQRLWPHVRAVRLAQRVSDCRDLLRLPLSPLAPDPHLSQPPGLPADTHTGPGTPGKACGKLGCAPVRAPPSVSGLRGVAGPSGPLPLITARPHCLRGLQRPFAVTSYGSVSRPLTSFTWVWKDTDMSSRIFRCSTRRTKSCMRSSS